MIAITTDRFLYGSLAGILVIVALDVLTSGLALSGKGPLAFIWRDDLAVRRATVPPAVDSAGWRFITDVVIGVIIAVVVWLADPDGAARWALTGLMAGAIGAMSWVYVYAVLEIRWRLAASMAVITLVQSTVAALVIGAIYHS